MGIGVAIPLPAVVVVLALVVVDEALVLVVEVIVVERTVVVVVAGVIVADVVVATEVVVVIGSSVTAPITQYSLLKSRVGQLIPGFNRSSSSIVMAQMAAKLSQVAPLSAVAENAQSTERAMLRPILQENQWQTKVSNASLKRFGSSQYCGEENLLKRV